MDVCNTLLFIVIVVVFLLNARMTKRVAKDPHLAAILSMIANGKSIPYAIAKVYGKEEFSLEGEDLEEYETGYQEK
jgi:hypothetical protein